jgi:Glycosyl hydrolase family 26
MERTRTSRGTRRVASLVVSLAVAAPLLVAVAQAPATAAVRSGPLVPKSGALLGAYVDPDGRWTGNADAEAEVTNFESVLGRKLGIDHHYYAWTDTFPSGLEQWDLSKGRIPLISWNGTNLSSILNGSYDGMITARAQAVKALGAPVFLRWCWEMNGEWSACGGATNNSSGTHNGPSKYVAAYRHIHDLFEAAGATNVAWIWCPNDQDVPSDSWNHWTNYYPGDAYVDWVGIDGYNWGTVRSWSSWTSFASLFGGVYHDYADRKPIMITETSSTEKGGSKPSWITSADSSLKRQFPGISALIWFDVNKEADWRPNSTSQSLKAFRQLAHDSYFGGTTTPSTSPSPAPKLRSLLVASVTVGPRPVKRYTSIRLRLSRAARVAITVRKPANGTIVRNLRRGVWLQSGSHVITWHRRNNRHVFVKPGTYRIRVEVTRSGRTQVETTDVRAVRIQ